MANNVRILVGSDTYRLRERLNQFTKLFREKFPHGEVESFTEGDDLKEAQNALMTDSLFGGKRLVLLDGIINSDNWDDAKALLEKISGSQTASVIVVMANPDKRTKMYKTLIKSIYTIETFNAMKPAEIAEWCAKSFECIQMKEAKFLIERCGTNMWNLASELKKLGTYTNGNIATKTDILAITNPHPEAEVWGVLRSFSEKNATKTMARYKQLRASGTEAFMVLAMLMREARIHTRIKAAKRNNLPTKATGISPFVLKQTEPMTQKWSWRELKDLYQKLAVIDRGIKTGKIKTSTQETDEIDLALESIFAGL